MVFCMPTRLEEVRFADWPYSEQAICMQSVANANKIKQLALPLLDTSPQANPSFFVCTRFPLQFQSYHHPYQDTGENTHHFDVIKGRVSEDKCFLPPTTFYVNSKKEKETYHSSSSCLGKERERGMMALSSSSKLHFHILSEKEIFFHRTFLTFITKIQKPLDGVYV